MKHLDILEKAKYIVCFIGETSSETIRRYIESQG